MNLKSTSAVIVFAVCAPMTSTSAEPRVCVEQQDEYCVDPDLSATELVQANELSSLPEVIDAVCADRDGFEDGEQPPAKKTVEALKTLIADGNDKSEADIRIGEVATYFGEVSVTWRSGNKMLRATSRPEGMRLDYGTTPDGALGEYQFDLNPTGERLVERLAWLYS